MILPGSGRHWRSGGLDDPPEQELDAVPGPLLLGPAGLLDRVRARQPVLDDLADPPLAGPDGADHAVVVEEALTEPAAGQREADPAFRPGEREVLDVHIHHEGR